MTDFTVPAYSKVRCDLAATAPHKGATAEEVRAAWAANLKASTLKGAKELEARLTDKADPRVPPERDDLQARGAVVSPPQPRGQRAVD